MVRNFADQLKIVTCNIDEHPELGERYGVMNIPSLLFFKKGQLVDRAIGYMNDISEAEVAAKCTTVMST